MKVELTPDAAHWVQAELAAGRFPTAEDAIRHAVNQAKLIELRDELAAAEAEGGSFSTDEVRRYARYRLDRGSLPRLAPPLDCQPNGVPRLFGTL